MTLSRADIHDLLGSRGLAPQRALGQNFVADPNTVRRIARLAEVGPGDHVVEIGPGLGSLTLALAESGAEVTAIEVDTGIVPILREVVADATTPVRIVEADATELGWVHVLDPHDDWTLVANLPYNVATPLVCDVLDGVPQVRSMIVMVQREVAERFVAAPGSKAYGAVSVKIAYWASAAIVARVPSTVFVPRPNVESAIVRIVRHTPPAVDAGRLFDLVRIAFAHRRKMLRRTLGDVVDDATFERAGIDPERRPETLSLEEWCRLVDAEVTPS